MRIVHLSDVHVWRLLMSPLRLMGKRSVGIFELLSGRARRFRLERLGDVVERVVSICPDHLLITGDLTTTALPSEFAAARLALEPLLVDRDRVTILPGNHDRYTHGSMRSRAFEGTFGMFAPASTYPWLRCIGERTSILGLDPTRPHLSARGRLPADQFENARAMIDDLQTKPHRLIVACHYPVVAPPLYRHQLRRKKMANDEQVAAWLSTIGPHLYCCGHVHAAWAFQPEEIPGQLCLNSGAPLLRDPDHQVLPGFLEIDLHEQSVSVTHHAWAQDRWIKVPLYRASHFFERLPEASS